MSKWKCVKCGTEIEVEQSPQHCGAACVLVKPAPQEGSTQAQGKTQQEGKQPQ